MLLDLTFVDCRNKSTVYRSDLQVAIFCHNQDSALQKKRSNLRTTTGEPQAKNGWRNLKGLGSWLNRVGRGQLTQLCGPSCPRTRDSNGDGYGDFAGTCQDVHRLSDVGISGPLLKQKMSFPCNCLGCRLASHGMIPLCSSKGQKECIKHTSSFFLTIS